jgi:hypothetical protein
VGSCSTPVPLKASLSSVPSIFLPCSSIFYLSPNVIVLLYLDSFDFFRNLDPILPFPLMISLGSLGQMGDVDPTEMIDLETGRIPLKHASLNLADSDGCFRSWTGYAKGWRNWYYRVSTKNRGS